MKKVKNVFGETLPLVLKRGRFSEQQQIKAGETREIGDEEVSQEIRFLVKKNRLLLTDIVIENPPPALNPVASSNKEEEKLEDLEKELSEKTSKVSDEED